MAEISRRIFVSAPLDHHLTPEGREIKAAVSDLIERRGFKREAFSEAGQAADLGWTFENAIRIIRKCQGAVVLALARHRFKIQGPGREKSTVLMPSEWAHCEGAISISKGIPTFVIAEEGIADKGIAHRGSGRFILEAPAAAGRAWVEAEEVRRRIEAWLDSVRSQPDVFLGYCSRAQSTADAVHKFLDSIVGVTVRDWAVDFVPGRSIMAEVITAASMCRCGVFLFTKDDALEDRADGASPRDNVLLEAGYFLAAKGKDRVLIVREEGTKMPADLGGDIYVALKDRHEIAPIETKLQQFVKAAVA